jgi:hypothetical protein
MNVSRFISYILLASWVGLTVVTVGTALQWSEAHSTLEMKLQRTIAINEEVAAKNQEDTQRALKAAHEGRDLTTELQRRNDRSIARLETASQGVVDAATFEQMERKQFWWEFGAWLGITLLGSAFLAFLPARRSEARGRLERG